MTSDLLVRRNEMKTMQQKSNRLVEEHQHTHTQASKEQEESLWYYSLFTRVYFNRKTEEEFVRTGTYIDVQGKMETI